MSDMDMTESLRWLISGISLPLNADEDESVRIAASEMKRAGIPPARLHFRLYKKSIDARRKQDIRLVYSVLAEADEPIRVPRARLEAHGILPLAKETVTVQHGTEPAEHPPVVVGMGPAGMFCALLLAEEGYCPVLIDRGDSVEERCRKNDRFIREGILDTESNIQFGAGGAGTFSDGKLVTRIHDPKTHYVLERLVEFGAPEEILLQAKPHIGTDVLVQVVSALLRRIEALGGRVIYRCRMDDVRSTAEGLVLHTTCGDMLCSSAVLALGHSARDTYAMLMQRGLAIEAKPFSVGVRIEHLREDIDRALYGDAAGHPRLGKGEYHLSDTKGERGVYTFCMCPGGEVVGAASEEGGVVVNGMSRYARDGRNSNCAVAVSVMKEDYGATPEQAIAFQRRMEQAAFEAGGRDYRAPVQTLGDFMEGRGGSEPKRILPTYRQGAVTLARLDTLFPQSITNNLRRGFASFDRKLTGFAVADAILTGVETRTSAPVRILRTDALTALGHDRIYPCGEGAGYAGGITSAAVDGIKTALSLMARFAPCKAE